MNDISIDFLQGMNQELELSTEDLKDIQILSFLLYFLFPYLLQQSSILEHKINRMYSMSRFLSFFHSFKET